MLEMKVGRDKGIFSSKVFPGLELLIQGGLTDLQSARCW